MAVLASAAPVHANDRTMYQLIALGDYARAERMLLAEQKRTPERPELLLNLAAVYAKTNRVAEARALYAEVLDRPAVALDMLSGRTVSSHDVALTAMTALPPRNAIAAR
ncbi:hypothetical protein CKY28_15640 [Sphingomonas lenta]|uniref:Tetratricopeptide repeat protein n=2 Tax=Sphingomonas lenta TaxID=1141887 RepID=A0A2A2SC88_9SPHN|nr:hypothetical protein CKY28_15640 [Sphingomonas lenta]